MDYPVTQQDILLCTLPNRVARLKVELLTMQGQTLLELTSETIDGGLTIESESDVRRIVDLTLECINETYNFGADKRIWFDKKIGLSYGILAPDDVWHDYPLGVFTFTGANFSYDENASRLKISAADLMAFTLQDRGSQIGASEVVIEVDSNIRNAMIETLKRFTPLVDYAIAEFPADQQVVPYDVSVDSGAYPHDIIKKLRDLYPNYETYIDAYGTFVCDKIPERTDDPLFLDETVIDPLIISEQVRTDFGVRNVTEIWGAEIEPDRTMQECVGLGDAYHAALAPYNSMTIVKQPDSIRVAAGGQATFSVNVVGENLTYQWQYSDNGGASWINNSLEGSNTDTFTIEAASHRNGYLYRCLVSGRIFDDNQMPKATASGKVIEIPDVPALPIRGLTLYGKSEQFRTTGAQLFNASKAKNNSNVNVSLTRDTIELTVAADGQYRQLAALAFRHFDTVGETATISIAYDLLNRSNSSNNPYFVVYWYKDGKRIDGQSSLLTMEYPVTSNTFTGVAPEDNCDMGLIVCVNKNNTATAGDSVTIKNLMVSESTKPVPYEPYTGGTLSPSPSYPQEITSVGADGNVVVSSKAGVVEGGNEYITIITQPRGVSTPQNTDIVFSVVAKGEGLTYQWEYSTNGGKSWANSAINDTSKTSTLAFTARAYHNGYPYRCLITDKDGNKLRTNEVVLTIAGDTTVYDDPVTVQTSTITTPNGLTGVPVSSGGNYTDENGQQWIADTIEYNADEGTAKYVRRLKQMTLDSTVGWKKSSNTHVDRYYVTLGEYDKEKVPTLLCNIGIPQTVSNSMTKVGQIGIDTNRNFSYNYAAPGTSTLESFLADIAQKPITVVIPVTYPVETDLTTSEFYALRTQSPNTTLYNGDDVFMDIVYSTSDKMVEVDAISEHAALIIEGESEKLRIINQPQDAYAAMNVAFEFTVEATGVASYQWQCSSNGGKDWNNSTWASGTTATLTAALNESRSKMCFRCILTGADGTSLMTNTVLVHEIPSSIEIARQPVNAKAILGEIIHFSVSAKGATTYQWQRSVDGGSTWSDLDWTGNNTPVTYATAESSLITGNIYRCVLTAANGDQLTTNIVYAVDATQYVYVNDELVCVVPDADNEAGQKMAIEGLSLCPIIIRKYAMDGRQIDEPIVAGVMKAGYPYVLRYMDGVFLYEGELNVHAIVKEVSELPSEAERAQDQIDNDCRAIEYVVNPESPFTVERLGEIRQVLSGGEYEDIYTSQLAIERCRWENWKKTRMNDGATVTMLLLPFMEVNKKIRYTSPRTGEKLTYIVKSVSMDFSGSTMTLELVRFYPYYIWQ